MSLHQIINPPHPKHLLSGVYARWRLISFFPGGGMPSLTEGCSLLLHTLTGIPWAYEVDERVGHYATRGLQACGSRRSFIPAPGFQMANMVENHLLCQGLPVALAPCYIRRGMKTSTTARSSSERERFACIVPEDLVSETGPA